MTDSKATAALLIELGCEEIPAGVAPGMASSLLASLQSVLREAGLSHGASRWMGTPRRIVAHIADVQLRQPDRVEEVTGPPATVAFDADETPTRAGAGFARGQGVDPAALYRVQTAKGEYAALKREIVGRTASALIAESLGAMLRSLPQPKKMRWEAGLDPFIRPVRWLVALLGDEVLDIAFCGVQAGDKSWGHRFFADREVQVSADLDSYLATLAAVSVQPDPTIRSQQILTEARALARDAGGVLVEDEETLATTSWLVEQASPLLARFDEDFLAIPDQVILTTLKSHQKLFCVRGADGALLPAFIGVANTLTETNREEVAHGNCKVVSARLSDARFFYDEDCKAPLGSYVDKLDGRTWLQQLGTVKDKVDRIEALVTAMGKRLRLGDMTSLTRGARLCKADLSTRMVGEFPGLQGVIGADYALRGGEPQTVATVIEQHYLPRFAGDALPSTDAAAVVAVADRLDSIVGCFGIGLVPTGAQDPYALRRAALGVLHILAERAWSLSLTELLAMTRDGYGDNFSTDRDQLLDALQGFFRGRLKAWHQQLHPTDIVEAVLEAGFDHITTVLPRIEALAALRDGGAFEPLAITFKRVGNIVAKAASTVTTSPDPSLFVEPIETQLHSELTAVCEGIDGLVEEGAWGEALGLLSNLRPTVDRFFDDVMVMAEQAELRQNRLALMQVTGNAFAPIADFRRIQGKK